MNHDHEHPTEPSGDRVPKAGEPHVERVESTDEIDLATARGPLRGGTDQHDAGGSDDPDSARAGAWGEQQSDHAEPILPGEEPEPLHRVDPAVGSDSRVPRTGTLATDRPPSMTTLGTPGAEAGKGDAEETAQHRLAAEQARDRDAERRGDYTDRR